MHKILLGTVVAAFLVLTPSAEAGCYACVGSCCQAAESGKTGSEICRHSYLCIGSYCSCHDCYTTGGSCSGTAPPKCDKPLDNCEENRTFLTVPYGEPVDLRLLTQPDAQGPGQLIPGSPAARCSAA